MTSLKQAINLATRFKIKVHIELTENNSVIRTQERTMTVRSMRFETATCIFESVLDCFCDLILKSGKIEYKRSGKDRRVIQLPIPPKGFNHSRSNTDRRIKQ